MTDTKLDQERTDLLDTLTKHRWFLRHTVEGLSEEQAALSPTASELCVGGIVKHVAFTEAGWADFVEQGPTALAMDESSYAEHTNSFRMLEGDTVASVLAHYEEVAARTDARVASLPDLDASHPLPEAPWFEPGARWSARRVFLHILAETAQHAGHADILRETIDGQKTMG
ncbi:MAG: DinB family protein [Acidimicrobiales bacterium]